MKEKTRKLVECAGMVALATVLSLVKIYEAPLGGAVTLFSMTPIMIIGFIYGIGWGSSCAFVYSVIQLLLGLKTIGYVPTAGGVVLCILLDYILAFTLLGVTGVFKIRDDMSAKRKITMGIIGTLTACVLRYASHWLSGAVIWYEITKAGGWNDYVSKVGMWTYTTVYNAQYMVPETIMAVIAVPAMVTVISVVKKQLKR